MPVDGLLESRLFLSSVTLQICIHLVIISKNQSHTPMHLRQFSELLGGWGYFNQGRFSRIGLQGFGTAPTSSA